MNRLQSRLYSTTATFNNLYTDLSNRFLRDTLNTTNRNLVFRPKRSKELTSRKHPIIVNGEQLKPLEYKGKPGKGELFKLLSSVSTVDEYQQAKTTLINYARHSRESLQPLHFAHFLRAGGVVGQLEDAFRSVATHKLFTKKARTGRIIDTFITDVVYKELFRLRVIRSQTSTKPSYKFVQIYNSYSKLDSDKIDNSLLLTTALINSLNQSIVLNDAKTQSVFEKRLITNLEKLTDNVNNLSTESFIEEATNKDMTNSLKLPFVTDLTLAIEALTKLSQGQITPNDQIIALSKSIDTEKLSTIASAWSTTLPKEAVTAYIQSIQGSSS